MRSASLQHSSYRHRASLRSRAASLGLALGVTALIVVLLIELGILPAPVPHTQRPLVMFDTPPDLATAPTRAQASAHTKRPSGGSAAPKHAPTSPPPPAPAPLPQPVTLLKMNDADFAASDIGKMAAQPDDNAAGAGGGKDSGSVYGPGEGPGGEPLYDVAWYRRPTDAELAFYMPHDPPETGWGMVACRMIANYHVDNCREIGETPGSGFARTLRLAAWQFLVQPPRVGNKPLIGKWVRIRFDFTERRVPAGG